MALKLFLFSFLLGTINGIWGFLAIFLLDVGGDTVQLGLLSTVPGLIATFMQIGWGRMSDATSGRRIVDPLSMGYFLTAILSLPVIFATNPWHVIVATSFQVLFGSITNVTTTVLLAELLNPGQRVPFMSVYNPLGFVGNILGSVLGGFAIPSVGYRPVFLAYTALNLALAGYVRFALMPRSIDRGRRFLDILRSGFGEVGTGLRNLPSVTRQGGRYSRWVIGIAVRGLGIALFGPVLTVFLVNDLGASKPQIGTLNAIAFAVRLAASSPFGCAALRSVIARLGVKGLMLIGVAIAAVFPLLVVTSSTINQLMPLYLVNGFFWGCINTAWFAWQMNLIPKARGTYSGLLNFINGLAWALGPLFGGLAGKVLGVPVTGAISALVTAVGFVVLLTVPETTR